MKRVLYYLCAAALAVSAMSAVTSCAKAFNDDDIWRELEDHETRITQLETWQKTVNDQIKALEDLSHAASAGRQVSNVEVIGGDPGGHRIHFSEGTPAYIDIMHGSDGDTPVVNVPVVSVAEHPSGSGIFYWTLDGNFIEIGGDKVRASGIPGTPGDTPTVEIRGGIWFINGVSTGVSATGTPGTPGDTPTVEIRGGIWFINGTSTGIPATGTGTTGNDGTSPHIGTNGNWWIGETDTGVSATGTPGNHGTTPHIGANGNWWIGSTDTGVSASGGQGIPGIDGVTPQIRINAQDNEWEISYDNGTSWTSLGGPAIGEKGEQGEQGEPGASGGNAIFSGVDTSNNDYIVINLTVGNPITLMRYYGVGWHCTPDNDGYYSQNETQTYYIETDGGVTFIRVIDITPGWKTKITWDGIEEGGVAPGSLAVTAPATFDEENMYGEALILISDGHNTIFRSVTFEADIEEVLVDRSGAKVKYGISEPLDTAGVQVIANVDGGGSFPLTFSVNRYDFSTAGVSKAVVLDTALGETTYNVDVLTLPERVALYNSVGGDITLWADETVSAGQTNIDAGKTIRLVPSGSARRTVKFDTTGTMFYIANNSKLELAGNITLEGRENGTFALVTLRMGAIFVMNSGSEITGHKNTGSGGRGGGIDCDGGTLVLKYGSVIQGCSAQQGGGIYIVRPVASSGADAFNLSGDVYENSATDGGGLWIGETQLNSYAPVITGSVSDNSATNSGGGVFVNVNAETNVVGSSITNNMAAYGGAAYVSGNGAMYLQTDVLITENFASQVCGGVYVDSSATLSVATAEISGNLIRPIQENVMGDDVYAHCSGALPATVRVRNSSQIGTLCLFGNSSANSSIELSSTMPWTGTLDVVNVLQLMGDSRDLSAVKALWEDKIVINPGSSSLSQAILNRFVLDGFYTTAPYSYANIGTYKIRLTDGTLSRQ